MSRNPSSETSSEPEADEDFIVFEQVTSFPDLRGGENPGFFCDRTLQQRPFLHLSRKINKFIGQARAFCPTMAADQPPALP